MPLVGSAARSGAGAWRRWHARLRRPEC